VTAKPQDSVNIKEDATCGGLCKALGDFGKPLIEINLEKKKEIGEIKILSNFISGVRIPNAHQGPGKSQAKDAWGLREHSTISWAEGKK